MTGETTSFGAWLLNARKTYKRDDGGYGLTQKELADMVDVDNSYIGRIERNVDIPSREVIARLARVFQVPYQLLLTYAGKEHEQELEVITQDALYLMHLVSQVPKQHHRLAVQFLENLIKLDANDEEETTARTSPPAQGDSGARSSRQTKGRHT